MHKNWNDFVESHQFGTIHQTTFWGDFQAKNPGRDKYFIISGDGGKNFGGLFIRHRLPFGLSWLYCPRGPLCNYENPELAQKQLQIILEKLKPIAKKEKAVFVRIDPPIITSSAKSEFTTISNLKFPKGFIEAHAEYQPENTLVVNLSQTESEILAQMKPKGRYNIKLAQKHGVTVRVATAKTMSEDIDAFYKLLKQTCTRDGFQIHPKSYYENMLKILSPKKSQLFIAEHRIPAIAHTPAKTIKIAAAIITYFKDTATYYFGASDHNYRNLMAPYLIQWQALTKAKSAGLKFYDFLGIAPTDKSGNPIKSHHYSRITDFKLKFGGQQISYERAHEFIFKPTIYTLIKLAKRIL